MKSVAAVCLSAFALAVGAPVSYGATLKGSEVIAVLHIASDTTNAFRPDQAEVGPGIEFSAPSEDGGSLCEYTANLSAAKIAIRDVCTALSAVSKPAAAKPTFTLTLTDNAFADALITPLVNGLDLSYALTGDTLTFTFADVDPTTNRSTFAVQTAVTPEPASWQLLLLGMAGAGVLAYGSAAGTRPGCKPRALSS